MPDPGTRECLECGAALYGRKDRQFCSQNCKNHYHNKLARNFRRCHDEVFTKISRNYKVLEILLKNKITSAPIEDLRLYGFDDSCVTGYRKTTGGSCHHEQYRCFDIVYFMTSLKVFGIRRIDGSEPAAKPGKATIL